MYFQVQGGFERGRGGSVIRLLDRGPVSNPPRITYVIQVNPEEPKSMVLID